MIHSITELINHTEWNHISGTEDTVVEITGLWMKELVKKQTLNTDICQQTKSATMKMY